MANALQSLGAVWQRTSLVQRVILAVIALACIGACALLVGWVGKPEMGLLYTGLSSEDASKVVEKVREAGSTYELRDGGGAVYVPTDKVYSLRLTLASQGLPKGEQAGYRILDDEKIGVSPFSQRVNYNRAVEGELAKTIQLLDGVVSARVHIVRPEEAIFAGRDKESTATVVLRLKSGWRLTASNVAAISHLVAGSIEGLTPQKVVIVDAQGSLLSGQGDSELAQKAGSFIEYKRHVEEYLSRKAEDMLAAALGPNRATVRVDAVVDLMSLDSTVEKYSGEDKGISSEKTRSVVPTSGPAAKEDESTTEYHTPPKTIEHKSEMPGKVKSLTVAAFVDLTGPASSGTTGATTLPATKVTLKDAEEIIRSSIGMRKEDTLKVVDTPFYRPNATASIQADDEKQTSRDFYLEIARRSSLGVLVIGVLLMLKIFRRPKSKSAGQAALPGGSGLALAGEMGGLGGQAALAGDGDPEVLRARITRALQENPEEVKRLFLSWVESDKGEA